MTPNGGGGGGGVKTPDKNQGQSMGGRGGKREIDFGQ